MQKIARPIQPAHFLTSERVLREKSKILSYLRRDESDRRQRRDDLNEDLFFAEELVDEVSSVFHNKCAFCETKLRYEGRITHFRPLRFGHNQTDNGKEYYLWFAFEWRNLFYVCQPCAKYKGENFPIGGQRADFLSSYDNAVRMEQALLIDPTAEDPAQHLKFRFDGKAVAETTAGASTIHQFKLNRYELIVARRERINELLDLLTRDDGVDSEAALTSFLSPHSPHSGALQNLLRRALKASRLVDRQISRNPGTFARKFADVFVSSGAAKRAEFRALLEEMRNDEENPRVDESPSFYESIGRSALRPMPEFSAIDRELAHIRIKNFKAIGSLDLSFKSDRKAKSGAPSVMILGENSTGKSSVLAATALALVGQREASKLRDHFPSMVHSVPSKRFDQLDELEVFVEAGFHFSNAGAFFNYNPLSRTVDGGDAPSTIVLGYGPRRYFDRKKSDHSPGAAARIRTLFDPLYTIPYPGEWLRGQTGTRFDTIAAALRIVLALDDEDSLVLKPDYLAVRANGRTTPIDALSEGYRSVFIMTVDIIREMLNHWNELERAQGIVLIDELETHLHPRWKMQVMSSLRRIFPRVQFICTTHDPLCLHGMDDGEVMVLQRDETNQIFKVEDLPGVKGMSAEQLLTSDYFGLASTIDPTTEFELARLAGDFVRHSPDGILTVAVSDAASQQISNLTLGNSPAEQIIHEALKKYLREREARHRDSLPKLRATAVESVLKALRGIGD